LNAGRCLGDADAQLATQLLAKKVTLPDDGTQIDQQALRRQQGWRNLCSALADRRFQPL
jgi:hypothetical protein